jgi:hypothetical protein
MFPISTFNRKEIYHNIIAHNIFYLYPEVHPQTGKAFHCNSILLKLMKDFPRKLEMEENYLEEVLDSEKTFKSIN